MSGKIYFSKKDLREEIGRNKSDTLFIALRHRNLGSFKMTTEKRRTRHSPEAIDTIFHVVFFDADEVMKHYKDRINKYIKDPKLVARPQYISSWEGIIKLVKKIKTKKQKEEK